MASADLGFLPRTERREREQEQVSVGNLDKSEHLKSLSESSNEGLWIVLRAGHRVLEMGGGGGVLLKVRLSSCNKQQLATRRRL